MEKEVLQKIIKEMVGWPQVTTLLLLVANYHQFASIASWCRMIDRHRFDCIWPQSVITINKNVLLNLIKHRKLHGLYCAIWLIYWEPRRATRHLIQHNIDTMSVQCRLYVDSTSLSTLQGDGIFTPGGSASNMYGVSLARHHKFPESKVKGMRALPNVHIYTSKLVRL